MGEYGVLKESISWKEKNLNIYALNKIWEESIVNNAYNIQKKIIIRPRAIYWIWDRILLYNLLNKAFLGHLLYLWSNNKINTSLTHINTLTDFILYLIKNNKTINIWSNVFNIADQQIYNLGEIIWSINKIFFWKKPINLKLSYIKKINILWLLSQNYYKWLLDIFWWEKILDLQTAKNIWFISQYNFNDTLPQIYNRRKEKVWSISNMRHHRNHLPWLK
jgi:hypothetical protein